MAKQKYEVLSKDSKRVKVRGKADGKTRTLLTPTGKVAKFKKEIEKGVRITNDGKRKKDDNGNDKKLTRGQKAYRKGYIKALGEQAAIHKKKSAGNFAQSNDFCEW